MNYTNLIRVRLFSNKLLAAKRVAFDGNAHCFQIDLQAVKFLQKKEASKAYYKQIVIEHIFLETGYTQMDCDHIYSLIERSMNGKDLYFPQYYVESTIKSFFIGRYSA